MALIFGHCKIPLATLHVLKNFVVVLEARVGGHVLEVFDGACKCCGEPLCRAIGSKSTFAVEAKRVEGKVLEGKVTHVWQRNGVWIVIVTAAACWRNGEPRKEFWEDEGGEREKVEMGGGITRSQAVFHKGSIPLVEPMLKSYACVSCLRENDWIWLPPKGSSVARESGGWVSEVVVRMPTGANADGSTGKLFRTASL